MKRIQILFLILLIECLWCNRVGIKSKIKKDKKGTLKNKNKFWPFDKISYDVNCGQMNITHGIYDDDESHVTTSCKCGFDLFYMDKSKLMNQLNYQKAQLLQQKQFDEGYDCWNIQTNTCHIHGQKSSDLPISLKVSLGYFDEHHRFILRYKKWVEKPYFEHLFTKQDIELWQIALGTQDSNIICNRLCLGLMDPRIDSNLYQLLKKIECFGVSYPPDTF